MPPEMDRTIVIDASPQDDIVALIPALRAFARHFHADINDADDLAQETLTRAIGAAHQFRPGTSAKSWLFTIMRNTFNTRIRKAMREGPGAAECVSENVGVGASQEWSTRGHEISRAIERLPPEQREIIILIGVIGVSYLEAAEICGCAIGTVKSRLNRARARLLLEMGEALPATIAEAGDADAPEA